MRPGARRLGRVTRAPGQEAGDGSEQRRAGGLKSCNACIQSSAVAAPSVAVRPRLSYDASAPGPTASSERPAPMTSPSRARGIRARHPPVPRAPIRSRGRRRPRAGRRAAVRRDRPGPRAHAARPQPAQRRPPRPAPRASRARTPTSGTAAIARTFAAWRSDGTLRKDPRPGVYVYEQAYRVPGTDIERTQRGFFARLHLEPFGPDGGVLPHERTLAAPREDRYRLLRATGVNTSPVVVLYRDPCGRGGRRPRRGRVDDARSPRSPTTTASTTGCGPRRRRRRRRGRPPDRDGEARPGLHRRRAPSLRDGAALPRRAADDALVRAGPAVRLHPRAAPGRRRAADGAADPPRGARPRRGRAGPPPGRARRPVRGRARRRPRTSSSGSTRRAAWPAARGGSGS